MMGRKALGYLAENCTFIALVLAAQVFSHDQPWWVLLVGGLLVLIVHEIGFLHLRRYRKQRDHMRQVAIKLVRQWPDNDRADALDWVPDDILAAATPILTAEWGEGR